MASILISGYLLISNKDQNQTTLIFCIISCSFQILTIKTIVFAQSEQLIPLINFECVIISCLAFLV